MVDRATFEAAALRDGYVLREDGIVPHQHRDPHVHEVDVRLFILDGAFTPAGGLRRVRRGHAGRVITI